MSAPRSPAEIYESFMLPYRFRPWAGELLDRVDLRPGIRMLDVACGTGIVARMAAQRLDGSGEFSGIDMNPAMIEVAARAASGESIEIEWQVGKADTLPFPDRSFHLVTIQQGLQFFPDKPAALRECFRVLVPDGMLAIAVWSSLEKQGLQKNYAEAIERVTGSASMHAPYGAIPEATLRNLLAEAGFSDITIEEVTIEVDVRRSGCIRRSHGRRHLGGSADHARPLGRGAQGVRRGNSAGDGRRSCAVDRRRDTRIVLDGLHRAWHAPSYLISSFWLERTCARTSAGNDRRSCFYRHCVERRAAPPSPPHSTACLIVTNRFSTTVFPEEPTRNKGVQ